MGSKTHLYRVTQKASHNKNYGQKDYTQMFEAVKGDRLVASWYEGKSSVDHPYVVQTRLVRGEGGSEAIERFRKWLHEGLSEEWLTRE